MNSHLGFGRLSGSSDGSTASKTRNVLLFLLSGLQNLYKGEICQSSDTCSVVQRCGTNLERAKQTLVHAHHSSRVVKLSAVVWCTEQGHELTLGEELVSIFNDLMSPADQIHVMFLEETRHNVRAKCEADTSVIFAPSCNVLVGVGPQQVAKKTAIGDLL